MKTCNTIIEAQGVPGVVLIWAGPPVIAYEIGDTIPVEHLPTAADPKLLAWDAIKAERDRRKLDGGYKVAVGGVDRWFHSDIFSRTQQIGLVMLGAGIPAGLQWKTMSGEFVEMTPTLAQQVFQAAARQDMATFAAAEAHRSAMEAAVDPASYDFSLGWPTAYSA